MMTLNVSLIYECYYYYLDLHFLVQQIYPLYRITSESGYVIYDVTDAI